MQLNVLLLCNKPKSGNDANTIVDHIEALETYSEHKIWLYSNLGDFSSILDLNTFDVIIIHYSLSLFHNHYISESAKEKIRAFDGLKVVFIQDEYRQINTVISQLQYLKIDVLFTCFPEEEMEKIYSKKALPNLSLYNNLTGYIPERLLQQATLPKTQQRTLHLGYRGRKVPFWLGELAYEKWDIVEKWKHYVKHPAIKTDISYKEEDRIYGSNWQKFLLSCKATLGVESGASVMDFTGELERNIDIYQLLHPKTSFYKVQDLFLKPYEDQFKLNQISPRCFEAIALKTTLILYEGDYSGILRPHQHYIPLKKDYSNIDEVVSKLQDDDYLQNMAETAFKDIALNPEYSYQHYVKKVSELITQEWRKGSRKAVATPYTQQAFDKAIHYIPIKKKIYQLALPLYYKLPPKSKLVVKSMLRPKLLYFYCKIGIIRLIQKFRLKSMP